MRRVKERVSLEECKRRALSYLQEARERDPNALSKASGVAGAIWPGVEFHAQGAGAAASRILKHLERDGLVQWDAHNGDWGWRESTALVMGDAAGRKQ